MGFLDVLLNIISAGESYVEKKSSEYSSGYNSASSRASSMSDSELRSAMRNACSNGSDMRSAGKAKALKEEYEKRNK